ncbi:hypothetical protein CBL_11144 [Carabus blaptoides fortunei]
MVLDRSKVTHQTRSQFFFIDILAVIGIFIRVFDNYITLSPCISRLSRDLLVDFRHVKYLILYFLLEYNALAVI